MRFLDRFLKKKEPHPQSQVETEYINDDIVSQETAVEIHSWEPDEEPNTTQTASNPISLEDNNKTVDEVNINYSGGLLSPITRTKQEQYDELLNELEQSVEGGMQTVLGIIERALQEEEDIHDVFARIEEQNIPILALVALELASEEDIAAYQLKKERNLSADVFVDEEYSEEVKAYQMPVEEVKEPVPYQEMDKPTPLEIFDGAAEVEPTVTDPVAKTTYQEWFEGASDPVPEQTTPFPVFEEPGKVQEDETTQEAQTSTFPGFEQNTQELPVTDEVPFSFPVVEPAPVSETPFSLPEEEEQVFNFKQTDPQAADPFDFGSSTDTQEVVAENDTKDVKVEPRNDMFASIFENSKPPSTEPDTELGLNFEGYIEDEDEEEPTKPAKGDSVESSAAAQLGGLTELLTLASKLGQNPPVSEVSKEPNIPVLTEEQREKKRRSIKKFVRQQNKRDKRLFIIWDGIQLPKVEGYEFIPVTSLNDLNTYGLDTDDLLIVTSKIPKTIVEDVPTFVQNILEDSKPYRVATISKKAYTDVDITVEILGFTKDALDLYYEENVIEIDNKNQLSGFQGFADFISKDYR